MGDGDAAPTALGLRIHTARATAIVVQGAATSPEVAERARLELWDRAVPDSRQPYHVGLELSGAAAEEAVRRASEAARAVTLQAVREFVARLRAQGRRLAGVGLVVGSEADPDKLGNPHVRAHAAEGRLFREAVAAAADACELPHRTLVERDLYEEAALVLGRPAAELKRAVTALGKPLGPPWRAEEKGAALAAWLALAGGAWPTSPAPSPRGAPRSGRA